MQVEPFITRPVFLLRAEAFCIAFASCAAYRWLFPHHWMLFASLFLVPDIALLMYAGGPGAAASMAYNTAHSYVIPALLGAFALHSGGALLGQVSLVWIFHIGLDRLLGFGLKYPDSFKITHLQRAAVRLVAPNL